MPAKKSSDMMTARRGDLAKALEAQDLTSRELAARCGLADATVVTARSGRPIRRSVAAAICGGLQIPIGSLFTRVPSEKVAA
jgi:DNA-binding Xre family transcriptional regulator